MGEPAARVPGRAWAVVAAGTAVNLCLGILYAWSVWKKKLLANADHLAGSPMAGADAGWAYLADWEATTAYSVCGFVFALSMIPGGRLQDRFGPRAGATIAGVCLGLGCAVAGLSKSFLGLVVGFGLLGGVGMGFGYAAATPAAVRWFGPHRRGLIAGIVVAGYGAAAVYIAPVAEALIGTVGLTGSFVWGGVFFAAVVIGAGQLLRMPPAGYAPPAGPAPTAAKPAAGADRSAGEMLRTWQYFALVFLFVASAQAGLLVIANAAVILKEAVAAAPSWVVPAWALVTFGGAVNAAGRVGTGTYSDLVGRANAYGLNGLLAAGCMVALPGVIESGNVALLFPLVGVVFWQYGGTLALMPAFTADFYGSKNLGLNYGLVFLGWGIAFFVPLTAGIAKQAADGWGTALYPSAGLLLAGVAVSRFLRRPV